MIAGAFQLPSSIDSFGTKFTSKETLKPLTTPETLLLGDFKEKQVRALAIWCHVRFARSGNLMLAPIFLGTKRGPTTESASEVCRVTVT